MKLKRYDSWSRWLSVWFTLASKPSVVLSRTIARVKFACPRLAAMFGIGMNAISLWAIGLIRSAGIMLPANGGAAVAIDRAGRRIVDAVGEFR